MYCVDVGGCGRHGASLACPGGLCSFLHGWPLSAIGLDSIFRFLIARVCAALSLSPPGESQTAPEPTRFKALAGCQHVSRRSTAAADDKTAGSERRRLSFTHISSSLAPDPVQPASTIADPSARPRLHRYGTAAWPATLSEMPPITKASPWPPTRRHRVQPHGPCFCASQLPLAPEKAKSRLPYRTGTQRIGKSHLEPTASSTLVCAAFPSFIHRLPLFNLEDCSCLAPTRNGRQTAPTFSATLVTARTEHSGIPTLARWRLPAVRHDLLPLLYTLQK